MPGRSVTVTAASYRDVTLWAENSEFAAIRSVTVTNQSSAMMVAVYLASSAGGTPYTVVAPMSNITLPCQDSRAVTFRFIPPVANVIDGAISCHVDSEPLAASGFTSGSRGVTLVWDQGAWDNANWGP